MASNFSGSQALGIHTPYLLRGRNNSPHDTHLYVLNGVGRGVRYGQHSGRKDSAPMHVQEPPVSNMDNKPT